MDHSYLKMIIPATPATHPFPAFRYDAWINHLASRPDYESGTSQEDAGGLGGEPMDDKKVHLTSHNLEDGAP